LNDADLKEWAERIWGAVEYGHNPLAEMKAFIAEYDRDVLMVSRDNA